MTIGSLLDTAADLTVVPGYTRIGYRIRDLRSWLEEQVGGFIAIPGAPGIGVELVEDVEKRFPYRPRPIKMRPHVDGSVVDM